MSTKGRKTMAAAVAALAVLGMGFSVWAQNEAPAAPAPEAAPAQETKESTGLGFVEVVGSSGAFGVVLWLALGACSVAAVALAIDSFITIKDKKISPEDLVTLVREAMEQGDVMKALKHCDEHPTPLANILTAGFSNVQEGYDVIQDVVGVAADMESEKLMQRVAYLNVCANLAPMLGLLGTVQGMIMAFGNIAGSQMGAAQTGLLAKNIAQALWTTAGGLVIAIPAISFYTYFKNRATKIILSMESLTMDLIKSLRNVEVVAEEE